MRLDIIVLRRHVLGVDVRIGDVPQPGQAVHQFLKALAGDPERIARIPCRGGSAGLLIVVRPADAAGLDPAAERFHQPGDFPDGLVKGRGLHRDIGGIDDLVRRVRGRFAVRFSACGLRRGIRRHRDRGQPVFRLFGRHGLAHGHVIDGIAVVVGAPRCRRSLGLLPVPCRTAGAEGKEHHRRKQQCRNTFDVFHGLPPSVVAVFVSFVPCDTGCVQLCKKVPAGARTFFFLISRRIGIRIPP